MKLSESQQVVLSRLVDLEYPDNQPGSVENYSVDALIRRGLVKHVKRGNRYAITRSGEKALKDARAADAEGGDA